MKLLAKTACALAALSAASAHAADDLRLQPTAGWTLDYADERCSLNRRFADGDEWLHLRIDSYGSLSSYVLMMVGSALPASHKAMQDVKYRLTPDAELRDEGVLTGRYGRDPSILLRLSFKPAEPPVNWRTISSAERMKISGEPGVFDSEFERAVDSLEIKLWNRDRLDLALGSMAKPLEAMRACVENLQASWGVDPASQAALTRLPVPKAGTVEALQAVYPSAMVISGTNGYVPVRVLVDANGTPTSCVVQIEATAPEFKNAVCRGLSNAFEPALDSAGEPTAGLYLTTVYYLLQG